MSVSSSKNTTDYAHALGRAGRAFGVVVWVILAFFLAAAVTVGLGVILDKLGLGLDRFNSAVETTIVAGVIYLIAVAITIGVPKVLLKYKTSLQEIGLHRLPSWSDTLIGPLGFIPYIILSLLLAMIADALIPGFDLRQTQDTGFNAITNQLGLMLAFFTLVVVAPIAEEAMFRGYLYSKLRRIVGVVWTILLTSLVFAFVHLQFNVGIDVFALSIVLCMLREVTGSIWAGILLHMTKNGVAFFLLFVYPML